MRPPKKAYSNDKKSTKGFDMYVKDIEPLTENQRHMMAAEDNIVASGSAGTGKTYLAVHKALKEIRAGKYKRLRIVRSAVPSRDMGHLPGTLEEKAKEYETPYTGIVKELCDRGDAYEILKLNKTIDFITTSYLRGNTISDCIMIVDECQNMSYQELDTIITRPGKNCKVIFCGDMYQADLKKNGIEDFYNVLRRMDDFTFIEFGIDDVVRSGLVKNYLRQKYELYGNRQLS